MARRKGTKRYTKAQKIEVLKQIQAGQTQVAVAAQTGIPLATVGYWVRKAKGIPKAKRGRPAGSRTAPKSGGIAWALDGDTLVIRIPLRVFARKIAQEALAKI